MSVMIIVLIAIKSIFIFYFVADSNKNTIAQSTVNNTPVKIPNSIQNSPRLVKTVRFLDNKNDENSQINDQNNDELEVTVNTIDEEDDDNNDVKFDSLYINWKEKETIKKGN